MTTKNTGGPAFPSDFSLPENQGMTLRDYFAAHAPLPPETMDMDEHCALRFRYADAMLRAREES